ncbi:MAG: hypothetical protein EOO46_18130 [Flavobacterium sp.]|nr:MAG: hypothetical protein EOO46_18130 [Flavobacterium sp.]
MKTVQLAFLILLAINFSCKKKEVANPEIEHKNSITFNLPVVIEANKHTSFARQAKEIQVGDYTPLYIGERSNSINLEQKPDLEKYNLYDPDWDYPRLTHSKIAIKIDTMSIISKTVDVWDNAKRKYITHLYNAYPVYLINTSSDTLAIGAGQQIPIVMEVKNSEGMWLPIEDFYIHGCGTGLKHLILPPKEIALTSATVNKGRQKTKLRLNLMGIYSEEFSGSYSYEQTLKVQTRQF